MALKAVVDGLDVSRIDVHATLRFAALLAGDPCTSLGPGHFERATVTPMGVASIRVGWSDGSAQAAAWGPGAAWLIDRIEGLVGLADDVTGFNPSAPGMRAVWERNSRLRIQRTSTLWHDLMWTVLQQRVRFIDASNSWRAMVNALGSPAPGPVDLMAPPAAETIARLGYHDLHPFGIERSRAETLIRAAREMPRLANAASRPFDEIRPRLAAVRGIGPWTLAGLEVLTWGSPDAVIVGDVNLPVLACWFLAREEFGTDERMIELLEPYRGHRYRAIQMCYASGARVPRRRPTRYGVQDIRRR